MRPGIAANRNRSGGAARASVGHDLDEEEYDADVGAEAVASKHDAVAVVANIEPVPREVIYLRYDEVNMRYVYLCAVCDTLWNTSQNNIL
jgi:hypothetical protein